MQLGEFHEIKFLSRSPRSFKLNIRTRYSYDLQRPPVEDVSTKCIVVLHRVSRVSFVHAQIWPPYHFPEQRDRLQAAIDDPDALRLVVDLNWAEGAPGKELSSLVKQLCYVYGRVKASAMPPRLTLTSYRGRAAASLDK